MCASEVMIVCGFITSFTSHTVNWSIANIKIVISAALRLRPSISLDDDTHYNCQLPPRGQIQIFEFEIEFSNCIYDISTYIFILTQSLGLEADSFIHTNNSRLSDRQRNTSVIVRFNSFRPSVSSMSIMETPTRERLTSVTVSPRFPWQQAGPIYSRWTSHTSPLASACHGDYTYLPSADAVAQIWEVFLHRITVSTAGLQRGNKHLSLLTAQCGGNCQVLYNMCQT